MRLHSVVRPLAAAAALLMASTAMAQNNVLFIFDGSGSMKQMAGPETRIATAKKAMAQALGDVPKDVRLGLLMYGHRRANDCTDIELVAPIGADDAATINRRIQSVDAKGETPIAEALRQAARSFAALKGQSNSIVLVTDGIEECKGDPCAAARDIKASGLDIKAHVVGFTLTDQQRKLVQCIPDITGGKYFEARDAGGLNRALSEVRQQAAAAPPAPAVATPIAAPPTRINLLAPADGGEVIVASQAIWGRTNDQRLAEIYYFAPGSEAVFGFRDGRAAKFDTFSVHLPEAKPGNVKDLELLVGDEGPTGPFRSLGIVTTANGKVRDGWQDFKLPETTAKFLKVRVLATHNGSPSGLLYELRLMGELQGDASAATATAAATPRAGTVDLLAPANGGEVIVASHAIWNRTNDQRLDEIYWFPPGAEAVFGFRGGNAATFDSISVFLPEAKPGNAKELELLAGDDGPTGPFRSIGVITTANAKVRDGWQTFKLPPTTAKFLKIRLLANHDGGRSGLLYEFRLPGEPAAAASGATAATPATATPAAAAAVPAPAPTRTNLLAASAGTEVLMASAEIWKRTIDGSTAEIYWFAPGSEAVYGFRNGGAATFDAFAVYLPEAKAGNAKELEVLVGDEGPTGTFRSLGIVTTTNARMRDGWQEFKLPETTAKFVKVKLLSNHDGGRSGLLYEFRLLGKPPS